MTRVSVQFAFTAAEKVSSRALDRIMAIVREWAADRFNADHIEASIVPEPSTVEENTDASYLSLAERIMSPDLQTHVEALEEFRDALKLYRSGKLQSHAASFHLGPADLLSFPSSGNS